jgi:hypothetical protein
VGPRFRHRHTVFAVAFLILTPYSPALAEQVCTLQITFENQTSGSSAGQYKVGVRLGKSLSRVAHEQLSPLNSKKTVWTQGLLAGERTTRTINVRFAEPCSTLRNFSIYACWKKAGSAGVPTCLSTHRKNHFVAGSWRWVVSLNASATTNPIPILTIADSTQIPPRKYK